MSANRWIRGAMVVAVMVTWPALAAAQLPSRDVSSWAQWVTLGQKVTVTTADDRKTKGQVLRLSPTTMDIGKGDVVTTSFAMADVQRVQAADSVANGVLTGALSLGLVGMLYGAVQDVANEGFTGVFTAIGFQDVQSSGGFGAGTGAVVGVAVGALLGWAIDSARVKTIYERGSEGMTVAVSPMMSAAGQGVGVRVRW